MIDSMILFIKKYKSMMDVIIVSIGLWLFAIMPLNTVPVDFKNGKQWLTPASQTIVNIWLIEGIVHDNFIMYKDFASVEFENNNNRNAYVSYPPGTLIPLYCIAKIIGAKEVSVRFVKSFVQFEYYLSIFILGIFFYVCLQFIEIKSRLLKIALSIIFSLFWAFLPSNVYYMKNEYFSDQAIILLSIIFFYIETLFSNKKFKEKGTLLQILSCIVMFAGVLTDYYFFCIAFVVICFRVINNFQKYPGKSISYKLFSNTWSLFITALIATVIFIIQVLSVPNGLKSLALTFSIRSGAGEEWGGLAALADHFTGCFNVLSIPVLLFVTIFCLIFPFIRKHYSEKKQVLVNWLSMIVLSTVLHTVILREHSIFHEFSMLKYNLVFTFIIFTLTCWVYLNGYAEAAGRIKKYSKIMLIFIICFLVIGLKKLIIYDHYYYERRIFRKDYSMAEFIRKNTNYYDVVYSPDYETKCQDVPISRKRIYNVSSLNEIPVDSLPDDAVINILISEETMGNRNWNKLREGKYVAGDKGNFYLIKFSKESFKSVFD